MRKRQQARTRSAKARKKGYKLTGLTRQEARQRAIKAWQTKRGRYHYNIHRQAEGDEGFFRRSARSMRNEFTERIPAGLDPTGTHIVTEEEMIAQKLKATEFTDDKLFNFADRLARDRVAEPGSPDRLSDDERNHILKQMKFIDQDAFIGLYLQRLESYRKTRLARRTPEERRLADVDIGDASMASLKKETYLRINRDPTSKNVMRTREGRTLSREEATQLYEREIFNTPSVVRMLTDPRVPESKKREIAGLARTLATTTVASNYSNKAQARLTSIREAERRSNRLSQIVGHDVFQRWETQQVQQAHKAYFQEEEFVNVWYRPPVGIGQTGPWTLGLAPKEDGRRGYLVYAVGPDGKQERKLTKKWWIGEQQRLDRKGLGKDEVFHVPFEERLKFEEEYFKQYGKRPPPPGRVVYVDDVFDPAKSLPFGVKDPREKDMDWNPADTLEAYNIDAKRLKGVRNQGRLLKDQYLNRAAATYRGDNILYIDEKGNRTYDRDKAKLFIRPNKQYEYTLRQKNRPGEFKTQNVDIDDVKTRLRKPGIYDSKGQLKENQFDPIAGVRLRQVFNTGISGQVKEPIRENSVYRQGGVGRRESVIPGREDTLRDPAERLQNLKASLARGEITRKEYNQQKKLLKEQTPSTIKAFAELAERTAEGTRPLPKGIEQEIIIPVRGITKRSSKDIPSRYLKNLDPSITDQDLRYHAKTRVTYVPVSEYQIKRGQEDTIGLATKKRIIGYKPEEGSVGQIITTGAGRARQDRLKQAKAVEKHEEIYRALESNFNIDRQQWRGVEIRPGDQFGGRPGDKITKYIDQREGMLGPPVPQPPRYFTNNLRHELNLHQGSNEVGPDGKRVKDVEYTEWRTVKNDDETNRRLKDLRIAAIAATYYGGKKKFTKKAKPWTKNKVYQRVRNHPRVKPHVDQWRPTETWGDIKTGVYEPLHERAYTKLRKAKNPLSGAEASGINVSSWKYREHWIKQPTYERRLREKAVKDLQEMHNMHRFFEKNSYSTNRLKRAFAAQRQGARPSERYARYGDDLLEEISKMQHVAATAPTRELNREARKHLATLNQMRREHFKEDIRSKNWTGDLGLVPYKKGTRPTDSPFGRGPHEVFKKRRIESPGEAALVGGAIVGTTLGSHYLYHRHQERSKPPEERTHYLNKILPKPVTIKQPAIRTVKRYVFPETPLTHELGLAKRKLPVAWGVRLEKKKYTFRPEDKGYARNFKIIGNVKAQGPRGEASLWESTAMHYGAERKRSYKRGTHELYVRGRKVPAYIRIGDQEAPELSSRNPERITQAERERIVKAFANTEGERKVRQFYWDDKEMQIMFEEAAIDVGVKPGERPYVQARAKRAGERREAIRKQREEDWRGKKARFEGIPELGAGRPRAVGGPDTEPHWLGQEHPAYRDKNWYSYEQRDSTTKYPTPEELERRRTKRLPPHWLFPRNW